MATLTALPEEVLEHVALFAATHAAVGPPSALPALLLVSRDVHRALSSDPNPRLYARIFACEFDTRALARRLGPHAIAPRALVAELKKRWSHLKRIRARADARTRHPESHQSSPTLIDLLWSSYLMMLENDGKNERQLLDYAQMDAWLLEYWFDDHGASSAARLVLRHAWPIQDDKNAIAMCLLWLLLRPNLVLRNPSRFSRIKTITKLTALAANHYPVCHPSWTEFLPRSEAISPPSIVTHFSETYTLYPPALAPTAILVFLTLILRVLSPMQTNHPGEASLRFPASLPLAKRRSEDWDPDWYRCISPPRPDPTRPLSDTYTLGSMEGVWEGVFTYTEFSAYSVLLSGGAPSVIDHCLVAHHRQTWKLREYYLVDDQERPGERSQPLTCGDPLRAHFPVGTQFLQTLSDSVNVQEPGKDAVRYWRLHHPNASGHRVLDVILLGEGHSAWGQFSMYGRVRPLDGFISLSKEYVEGGGDRGKWLYRGYLVGDQDGHVSGRWRDTLSPSDLAGYEGCFAMSRRR